MADRRMLTKQILDSDAFMDMPLSSQALYVHLNMRADDDGFVNNPKKIQRMIGASDDDLKLLIAKKFIIPFESGIVVIKHWKMHNYIAKDRYKETVYQEEKSLLEIKDNNSYTLGANSGSYTECIQDVYELSTQVRLGKDRLGKDNKYIVQKFDEFWEIYPKKQDKAKAKEKFITKAKQTDPELILIGAKNFTDWCLRNEKEPQYIPMPTTWLNGERWNDVLVDKVTPVTGYEAQRRQQEKESEAAAEELKRMLRGESACKRLT